MRHELNGSAFLDFVEDQDLRLIWSRLPLSSDEYSAEYPLRGLLRATNLSRNRKVPFICWLPSNELRSSARAANQR